MRPFLILCLNRMTVWTDFYLGPDVPPTIHGFTHSQQINNNIPGQFFIFHVSFTTTTTGTGGAICIKTETKLLLESSNFIQCSATGKGGALYILNAKAKSALKMVCSINSASSDSYNHFCYVESSRNFMDQTSISSLNSSTRFGPNVGYKNGYNTLSRSNISNNYCDNYPGLYFSSALKAFVSYTTFETNTACNYGIMAFLQSKEKNEIDRCNIIDNNVNTSGQCIIKVDTIQLIISNTYMGKNNINEPMFDSTGAVISLYNCSADNTKVIGGGSVTAPVLPDGWKKTKNELNNDVCFANVNMGYYSSYNKCTYCAYNKLDFKKINVPGKDGKMLMLLI